MALNIKSNRLIPILAAGVALIVVLVALRSGEPPVPAHKPMTEVPKPQVQADADSPSDTLRTLATDVRESRKQMAQLSQENQSLKDRNAELARDRTAIEESVTKRLADQFSRPEASHSPVISGVSSRIDALEARLATFAAGTAPAGTAVASGSGSAGGAGDIPAGLGYEGGSAAPAAAAARPATTIVWTEPMGRAAPKGGATGAAGVQPVNLAYADPLDALAPTAAGTPDEPRSTGPGATRASQRGEMEPWFTIPENATLIGSTGMTALVGRIPVDGKVTDPVPFKALIGRHNLAANGLTVPDEIIGMVVSGKAVGDWTLECAYGDVESVTFLFDDGTIRTVSNRTGAGHENGSGAGSSGGGSGGNFSPANNASSNNRIAWISDERGLPCLSGRKITNAPAYLSSTVALQTLQIGAEAAAAAQTTQQGTPLGGTQTSVTGDTSKYIAGQAVAGGVSEITKWVNARLRNSFDAIYVPAGASLALHIDRAINIDRGPDSRRLDYRRQSGAPRAALTATLD